jgi:hypothetical protein
VEARARRAGGDSVEEVCRREATRSMAHRGGGHDRACLARSVVGLLGPGNRPLVYTLFITLGDRPGVHHLDQSTKPTDRARAYPNEPDRRSRRSRVDQPTKPFFTELQCSVIPKATVFSQFPLSYNAQAFSTVLNVQPFSTAIMLSHFAK